MKRVLTIVLAALLCAAMLTGALAEAPVLVSQPGDADWIDGSNLLRIRGENGYFVATMDGTALTGEEFASSIYYEDGVITAAKLSVEGVNAFGALNQSGEEVVPFQYGDIDVLSDVWVVGVSLVEATKENYDYNSWFSDDVYLIDTVDIYNVATGTKAATLTRAEYSDAKAFGEYINVENRTDGTVTTYDASFNALGTVKYTWSEDLIPQTGLQTFRDNGQYGLMDADGNVVMQPSFYTIYDFSEGYAEVSTGEKSGLIDEAGNVIIPAVFDKVNRGYNTPNGTSRFYNAGYFCVVQDGKLGYAVAGGTVTCEPKYSADVLDNNGASATYTDMEGKVHIVAGDGVETVLEGYDSVYPLSNASGVFYRVTNADYDYGMIDFHGNEVLPLQYGAVSVSGDGRYVLVDVDYRETAIYEITYPEAAAGEAAAPAEGEGEAEGEAPADSENSGIIALLDSAIVLLNQDPAANSNTVVGLLNSAYNQLGAESAAGAIINGAINTLQSDPAANGAAVVQLLENVKSLL